MVNLSIVVGRVTAVVNTERADLLIVEDNSNPQYPQKIACEFFGDKNRKLIDGVGDGDLVRVKGSTRSREHEGKWYTNFSAFSLTRLDVPPVRQGAGTHREVNPGDPIPF